MSEGFSRNEKTGCLLFVLVMAILFFFAHFTGSTRVGGVVLDDGHLSQKGQGGIYESGGFAIIQMDDGKTLNIAISETVADIIRPGDRCIFSNGIFTAIFDAVKCEEAK